MKKLFILISLSLLACAKIIAQNAEVKIHGELKKWHKITLQFSGENTDENAEENPFLNYRLNVTFRNGNNVYTIPGFYAADGNASETSAKKGRIWSVRFRPDKIGEWSYKVSFKKGDQIAINEDPVAGVPVAFDGIEGKFTIEQTDKKGIDFRSKGRLKYVNNRYLQFSDSKKYFLKGGADSPENFLGYYEFDQTPASHRFEPHAKDWKNGDPIWQNGKGKNIIGALNYLANKGMNSVYFLTMNVQGDGKDVWPWNNINERYRFDCSKLDQWEIVFDHMDRLGLMLHIVTQETENELLLDIGELGVQRKLYYRELIARFAHHLAITWNLGEENGPVHWSPKGQNDLDRKAMAAYIKDNDPYHNFVALHTHSIQEEQKQFLTPLLGYAYLDAPSMQIHHPNEVHEVTKYWISQSIKSDKTWVVCQDEIGPADTGAKPDIDDADHDEIRSKVLWANLMAGGAGVEWYFGYKYAHNDLNCEDWRSRDLLWNQTKYALDFFQKHLPFAMMKSADDLTANPDDYVFVQNQKVYAIYLSEVKETKLNLFGANTSFNVFWYNPRKGGKLQTGSVKTIEGGQKVSIGIPPDSKRDWVALIKANKIDDTSKKKDESVKIISLLASDDFDISYESKQVKYYKDTARNVLAINAEDKSQRNQFANSITTFPGESGVYEVTFIAEAENDGESSYVLKINGSVKDTLTNPKVDESFQSINYDLGAWHLYKNDLLEISSNAVTNGEIPENKETAWSRGRWRKIVFTPKNLSIENILKDAKPFEEKNGFLSVEAEHFQYKSANNTKRNWYIRSLNTQLPFTKDKITNHYSGASSEAYIEALPDTRITHDDPLLHGENFYPISGDGATIGYKIYVNNPGRYYVWVKAFSTGTEDNGVHVGVNRDWPDSGARIQWCEGKNEWTWSSAQRVSDNHCGVKNTIFLDIEKPGEYVLMFSMREDGFEMDKWLMTKDINFIPK